MRATGEQRRAQAGMLRRCGVACSAGRVQARLRRRRRAWTCRPRAGGLRRRESASSVAAAGPNFCQPRACCAAQKAQACYAAMAGRVPRHLPRFCCCKWSSADADLMFGAAKSRNCCSQRRSGERRTTAWEGASTTWCSGSRACSQRRSSERRSTAGVRQEARAEVCHVSKGQR